MTQKYLDEISGFLGENSDAHFFVLEDMYGLKISEIDEKIFKEQYDEKRKERS